MPCFLSIIGLATVGRRNTFSLKRSLTRLKDIHLSPSAYNTALALYFIAYVIFEVPSNVSQYKPIKTQTHVILDHVKAIGSASEVPLLISCLA